MSDWSPDNWRGITRGACLDCRTAHVLRDGYCWTCEQKRKLKADLASQRAFMADLFYALSEPLPK